MNINYDITIDASNDECPLPTIRTKEVLDNLSAGKVLRLLTSKEGTVKNIRTFVASKSCELLSESRNGDGYVFYIRKL